MNNISLKIALLALKQRQLMIRADAASDEHKWITTETGSHIKVDGDGNIVAGAGGKFNGKPLSEMGGTKKFTKYATNAERAETAKQQSNAKNNSGAVIEQPSGEQAKKPIDKKNITLTNVDSGLTVVDKKIIKELIAGGHPLGTKVKSDRKIAELIDVDHDKGTGKIRVTHKEDDGYGRMRDVSHTTRFSWKTNEQPQQASSSPVLSNNLTKEDDSTVLSSMSQSEAANGDSKMNKLTPQMDFFVKRISEKGYSLGKENNGLIEIKGKVSYMAGAKTDTIAMIDPSTLEVVDFKGRMKRKGDYLPADATVAREKKEYGLYEAEKQRNDELNAERNENRRKAQAARDEESKAIEDKKREKEQEIRNKKDSIGKTAELILFKYKGLLNSKEQDFLNSISKKRVLSEKQDKWLRAISTRFNVDYTSKVKPNQTNDYEEEPDMPTQREDGSWYDAETGLDITNPKYMKSYF
jgi:hypothetical protein